MTSSLIHLAVLAAASVAEDGVLDADAGPDADGRSDATAAMSAQVHDERGTVTIGGTRLTLYGDHITVQATVRRDDDRAASIGAARVMTWVVRRDAATTVVSRGRRRERSRVDALLHATRHAACYARRARAQRITQRMIVLGRTTYVLPAVNMQPAAGVAPGRAAARHAS